MNILNTYFDRSKIPLSGIIIAFLFSLCYWIFVAVFSRNMVYWDHSVFTEVIAGLKPFNWEFIWSKNAEHQIAIQRLIAIPMAWLTNWNTVYENVLSSLCIFLGYVFFVRSRVFMSDDDKKTKNILLILATFLLINPIQYKNMLFAFQLPWGMLFLCFILFANIIDKLANDFRLSIGAAILLVMCTGLSMHGLAPLFYIIGYTIIVSLKNKRMYPNLIFLSFLSVILILFAVLPIPDTATSKAAFLKQPINVPLFLLGLVGNPFSGRNFGIAVLCGIAIISLFVFTYLRSAGKKDLLNELIIIYTGHPLIVMGFMVLLMFLVGRFRFGVDYCTASRYATFSILFNVGLFYYVFQRVPQKHFVRIALVAIVTLGIFTGYYSAVTFQLKKDEGIDSFRECLLENIPDFDKCNLRALYLFYPGDEVALKRMKILYEKRLSFFHNVERK